MLAEVFVFLQRETDEPLCGSHAYPYTAEYGCSNLLSMKRFHGVWAGNAHDCSLK